uniref:Chromo domain-containing protein n=1 Tax=Acrobeloides nanus TaxID=290746 RepID=A0A914C330_9BILA
MGIKRPATVDGDPIRKKKSRIYYINDILDKRVTKVNGEEKEEYLIKWMFYSDEANSWEPAFNILNKQLITDFENSRKNKPEDQNVRARKKPALPISKKATVQKLNRKVVVNHKRGRKPFVRTNRKAKREISVKRQQKVYGCQRGEKIGSIQWLFSHCHSFNSNRGGTVYASVKYENGTMEAVPVQVLNELMPKVWDEYANEFPLSVHNVGLGKKFYDIQLGEKIQHIMQWVRNPQGGVSLRVKYSVPDADGQYYYEDVPINIVNECAPDFFKEYEPIFKTIDFIIRNRKKFFIRINEPVDDQPNGILINGAPIVVKEPSTSTNIELCPISSLGIRNENLLTNRKHRPRQIVEKSRQQSLANILLHHDGDGRFVKEDGSKIDLCDCLDLECIGCWMPCKKCKGRKCGRRCRNNRNGCVVKVETVNSNPIVTYNPFLGLNLK